MIPRSESRAGTPISLIITHTNEGPHGAGLTPDHTAEDLAAYLDRANAAGDWKSYHLICDDDSVVHYVPDSQAAWSALSANKRSLNICFTGWAAWPRSEWLLHDRMLRLGAAEVAKWAKAYSIPVRKLTPLQVGADWLGICGHWDWTLGKHNGNHTDPGANFPWDYFISLIQQGDDVTPEQDKMLREIHNESTMRLPSRAFNGAPGADTVLGYAANADGYGYRMERKLDALTETVNVLAKVLSDMNKPPKTTP